LKNSAKQVKFDNDATTIAFFKVFTVFEVATQPAIMQRFQMQHPNKKSDVKRSFYWWMFELDPAKEIEKITIAMFAKGLRLKSPEPKKQITFSIPVLF